jgi:hypothetical protein
MNATIRFALVFALALSAQAFGATRTLCYELVFKDDRFDCPVTGDSGVRRACQQDFYNWAGGTPDGEYTHPLGATLEVWDHDDVGPDEYIGTWIIVGSGQGCVTFDWEGEAYQNGESNPDLYVKWKSRVRASAGLPVVQAVDLTGNDYGGVTWRAAHLVDCLAGATCTMPGYLIISSDTTTELGGRAMALDSSQHMLELFQSGMDTGQINMGWPAPGSAAFDRGYYEVDETRADQGQSPAHELGHVLQMQKFGQDTLQNDCSLNGSGHSLSGTQEFESCVTTEGWAGYVAAVSFWDPEVTTSAPARFNVDFEEPTPLEAVCTDNTGIEGQAIKGFWDLDDANNEPFSLPAGLDDAKDSDTNFIADRWETFLNGTANRQNDENDVNGVNLKDFYFNNESSFALPVETKQSLLGHNCMGTMDAN